MDFYQLLGVLIFMNYYERTFGGVSMESNGSQSILGDLVVFAVIVLAVLKLAGIMSISWWLVFAPLLISIAVSLIIILIVLAVALVVMGIEHMKH